jgi:hypothetical protein
MTSAADRIRDFGAHLKRLSTIWIVLGNLVPVICVLAFDWPVGVLLLLYWSENVLIGAANVFKMLASGLSLGVGGFIMNAFLVPFFIFHYGMFCFVHGVFVLVIGSIGGGSGPNFNPSPFGLLKVVQSQISTEPGFGWSLLAITGMLLFSLIFDWLAKGRYKTSTPMEQMAEPYGRIIVLHIALLGGGFAIALLQDPIGALVILAVMKTLFDLGMVNTAGKDKSKDRAAGANPTQSPERPSPWS